MSDVVEEAAPLAPAATAGDPPSSCCCSANKRRSNPDDDEQLVKKSKKQLFNSPASTSSNPPLSPASTSRPSTSSGLNPPFSPASTSRPPRPPSALRRTISDPLPYSQVLKKLRDGMKELSICLDQTPLSLIESQEEQSQVISETDHTPKALVTYHQDGDEDSEANNSDESLSVEKNGDCLNIRFGCPCGKTYHFMVHQGSCFYRLM